MPISVATPLGPGAFSVTGFRGQESLSRLFTFHLDVVAESGRPVPFEALLGAPVVVRLELPAGPPRHFSGICSRISQGLRDSRHTAYRLEVVPSLWLLTKRAGSRAFGELAVPEILARTLGGEASFELGTPFEPYAYVVQYRETDFAFASRLMEDEGIFYFFRHAESGHGLVVANTPASHPDLGTIPFDPRAREQTIYDWTKQQELTSGKHTLRDYHFQLPDSTLAAEAPVQETVRAGTVEHRLRLPANEALEVYDWPGEYAQRFDGVSPAGAEQPAELEKIFEDNKRTAGIRMQEAAAAALTVDGASTAPRLTAGHRFTLAQHFDANGDYVVTRVGHQASASPDGSRLAYSNTFTCIPAGLPFRPPRVTPRPVVPGPQPALVVGPPGEEVFVDKYARVKVQFFWDREESASGWIRVAVPYAGQNRGFFSIPEVGDEVLVAFEHGDPRRPYVLGRLWNANDPPPEREEER